MWQFCTDSVLNRWFKKFTGVAAACSISILMLFLLKRFKFVSESLQNVRFFLAWIVCRFEIFHIYSLDLIQLKIYAIRLNIQNVYAIRLNIQKVYAIHVNIQKVYAIRPNIQKVYAIHVNIQKVYAIHVNIQNVYAITWIFRRYMQYVRIFRTYISLVFNWIFSLSLQIAFLKFSYLRLFVLQKLVVSDFTLNSGALTSEFVENHGGSTIPD